MCTPKQGIELNKPCKWPVRSSVLTAARYIQFHPITVCHWARSHCATARPSSAACARCGDRWTAWTEPDRTEQSSYTIVYGLGHHNHSSSAYFRQHFFKNFSIIQRRRGSLALVLWRYIEGSRWTCVHCPAVHGPIRALCLEIKWQLEWYWLAQ